MRTVLLIRHGAVVEDAANRFIGWTDLSMSDTGEAQIRALAAALEEGVVLDAIYCSDLARSRRTAELLAGNRTIPIHTRLELREISLGAWEGMARRDVAERWPEEYKQRGQDMVNFRPPGGENFADLASRVVPLWQFLTVGGNAGGQAGTIAIASHAGVNRVILCHVLGMPLANLFRLSQQPGCLNSIEWSRNGPAVRLIDATRL